MVLFLLATALVRWPFATLLPGVVDFVDDKALLSLSISYGVGTQLASRFWYAVAMDEIDSINEASDGALISVVTNKGARRTISSQYQIN